MTVPAQPGWAEEHIRRLSAAGIQSAFQCYNINSFESVERLMRRGIYKGPLVMNWVAIGGGMDAPSIYSLANFVRAVPDGAVLTVESSRSEEHTSELQSPCNLVCRLLLGKTKCIEIL